MRSRSVLILMATVMNRMSLATGWLRAIMLRRQIVDLNLHLVDARFIADHLMRQHLALFDQ